MATIEELDAKRFRFSYRNVSVYITVSIKDRQPWEIFIAFPTSGDPKLELTLAGTDAMCRLASLALRSGASVADVCKQLNRASRTQGDMPALMVQAFEKTIQRCQNE